MTHSWLSRYVFAIAAAIAMVFIAGSAYAGAVLNQPGSLVSLGVNDLGHLIIVSRGRLCYINNGSGHYKPPEDLLQRFYETYLPTHSFRPLQKFHGIAWTIPERPTEACQALIGEELGLTLDPWRLDLEAEVNRKGRGRVTIENFGEAGVQFRVRWPSRASWLSATPTNRSLGPGRSASIQFVGQCGPNEQERRTIFWLDDGGGTRISQWVGEVVLDCRQSRPN